MSFLLNVKKVFLYVELCQRLLTTMQFWGGMMKFRSYQAASMPTDQWTIFESESGKGNAINKFIN